MIRFSKPNIVAIEDDEGVRKSLELTLEKLYQLKFFENAEDALQYLNKEHRVDAITLDLLLPGMSGIEALPEIKKHKPDTPVIVISAMGDAPTGVKAIKAGAYDYIVKPFMGDELRQILHHAVESNRLKKENAFMLKEVSSKFHPDQLIGSSSIIKECREKILQATDVMSHVLITGETGTGKELVAKAIHYNSEKRRGPFIALNCSALPRDLAESELFGHEKGAFTGASQKRIGAFEQAQDGTLFLDEIGDLELSIQTKLLRSLEEKLIKRVGGTQSFEINVRLISATNRNLQEDIKNKMFRQDLYYRICVFPIHLSPLRERIEDIPSLCKYWIQFFQTEMGIKTTPEISDDLIEAFQEMAWPGNVRELKNVIEAMLLIQRNVNPLNLNIKHLPASYLSGESNCSDPTQSENIQPFKDAVQTFERELIAKALKKAHGKISDATKILKITPRILSYRIKQLE